MMTSTAPLPYAIEYARSSRSICKKCKRVIGESTLRMSVNQPATFFDGNIDSWFHFDCFWMQLNRIRDEINVSSIRGVDWLRWEDQEKLRAKIHQYNEPGFIRSSTPHLFRNEIDFSTLKIEKSATNRGKCWKCSTNFEKGEIKTFLKSKAVHLKCLMERADKIIGNIEELPGWNEFDECWRLRATQEMTPIIEAKNKTELNEKTKEDGEKVKENAGLGEDTEKPHSSTQNIVLVNMDDLTVNESPMSPSCSKKRSATDEIECLDEDAKPGETEMERKRRLGKEAKLAEIRQRRIKNQADKLWEHFRMFEKMNHSDRLTILKENDQDIPEGHDPTAQVLERLADNALFGCPIGCQQCPNGKVVYDASRRTYVCTGYATEYSKCSFESKNPIRTPFHVSNRLVDRYKMQEVVFNEMCERLYVGEEDAEKVIERNRRKSKGGVRGNQFIYAAEAFDRTNRVPTSLKDITSSNTHIIKGGTVVDAKFMYADKCHVFKNETDGTLYQATLSFTDLSLNKNSYYKIQLLKDDTRELYYVFRSWGRVGTDVGDCTFEHYNKEGAIAMFQKLFHEKTKNDWMYRKHFRKMPGMFSYVETDYSEFAAMGEEDVIPGSKTLLPQPVKEVVMSIFDVENMKSALKSFEMDINKMPLGRLSHNQINQAFGVLNDLSDLLIEVPVNTTRILDSSNKFYTIIPHNFGMKVPEPIDSFHKIKEKNNMLNALLDIKFAYDQICGGENRPQGTLGVDPVDTNYLKLKCKMAPLEKGCNDWKYIADYLENTQGSTHQVKVDLVDILKLDRDTETGKFQAQIGNRRLLWHGSGKMNFAGILGQGLRIAPPEAPATGYMFGKGVYFADMFSKSFFYCRAGASEEAYLLLCDVALGEMYCLMQSTDVNKKRLPKGTHSVKGVGREYPNENGNFNHPDGYMIPKGPRFLSPNHTGTLQYNEYIVYDVDQIRLKYLVRVKIHHACRL